MSQLGVNPIGIYQNLSSCAELLRNTRVISDRKTPVMAMVEAARVLASRCNGTRWEKEDVQAALRGNADLAKVNPGITKGPADFTPDGQQAESKMPGRTKYHSQRTDHYASKKEVDWQKEVIELLHADGWMVCEFRKARVKKDGKDVYRTPFGADGVGFPDLIAVKGKRCLFIENKSENGHLRQEQEAWLIRLMNLHTESVVWRPSDREKITSELEETTEAYNKSNALEIENANKALAIHSLVPRGIRAHEGIG